MCTNFKMLQIKVLLHFSAQKVFRTQGRVLVRGTPLRFDMASYVRGSPGREASARTLLARSLVALNAGFCVRQVICWARNRKREGHEVRTADNLKDFGSDSLKYNKRFCIRLHQMALNAKSFAFRPTCLEIPKILYSRRHA